MRVLIEVLHIVVGLLAALLIAALASWARSGTGRGALAPRIDAAISPVCAGFADAVAAAR